MIGLILLSLLSAQPDPERAAAALQLCRPRLARKAPGEIGDIAIGSSRQSGSWTIIRGTMSALIGMGNPGPGSASAHHLIRARFDYACWTRAGRVKKIVLARVE